MGSTMANPDLRRKIKVRMRPDLIVNRQRYGGQTYFVVKDPVALRYFRFREEELFLLNQFDGSNTLDDIRHEFVEKFRPQRISVQELERFVNQLLQAGIATADTPQVGQRLFERYKKKRFDKLKQLALNILYIKIPIFDPERLLDRLMPYTRFLFTLPFFLLMLLLWACSGMLLAVNWETFMAKLPSYSEFFTWRNLLYFWVTLGAVKVLHEFGHGLSCKKFGGEVHEMGFLILVLSPCLYCNVTDAWMLPNKWHRAIIGAAGIYVELILASLFVWTWWFSEPGLLNTLSLSIIFICSVSTVIFNANPLLRFDGYYILSDVMEIPNLRERSNKYLGNQASKLFFGAEAVEDPYAPKRRRWFFILYAISAYLYRWLVTVGILWFLYTFLKPYKLGMISAMLACAAATTLIVVPIFRMTRTLRNRWRSMKVNKLRMTFSIASATAIVAAILLCPLPMRIDVPMILRPKDATVVFVQASGVLDETMVEDGATVTAGVPLGTLSDPELDKRLDSYRFDYDQNLDVAGAARSIGDANLARTSEKRAEFAYRQVDRLRKQLAKLEIVAPVAGTVISPPKESQLGTTFSPGQVFCQIGDPRSLEAFLVVEHSDTSLIETDQRVWLKFAGHVGSISEARITEIPSSEIIDLPQALSNKLGGEVATESDEQREIEAPMFTSYAFMVPVPNDDQRLAPGLRGVARIDIGYRSVYWRVKRYLQQTFHFRM